MPISYETYERVALEDGDEQWELACGRLRKKPGMTTEHNGVARRLNFQLVSQLNPDEFLVDKDGTRVRISTGSYYVPDLCVIPVALEDRQERRTGHLEIYTDPLPLLVEVWSPSTGTYDVETKLQEYQLRGDAEIWRIHPYEKTLTSWRRQPNGRYTQTVYRADAIVEPVALPGVRIALSGLFLQ